MEYEAHIKETIKIIREAIWNKEIDYSEEIRKRVRLYASDTQFGIFLMKHQQLAHDLLDALYNYIKIRHIELEEMLNSNLVKAFAPPSMSKLIYLAAIQDLLKFYGPPRILGLPICSIKNSIEKLKQRKKSIKKIKLKSNIDKIKSEYIGEIVNKKKIISEIKQTILREVGESKRLQLISILKKDGRRRSLGETRMRLIALIDLAVRGKVKLLYDKQRNLFIRRMDDSNGRKEQRQR